MSRTRRATQSRHERVVRRVGRLAGARLGARDEHGRALGLGVAAQLQGEPERPEGLGGGGAGVDERLPLGTLRDALRPRHGRAARARPGPSPKPSSATAPTRLGAGHAELARHEHPQLLVGLLGASFAIASDEGDELQHRDRGDDGEPGDALELLGVLDAVREVVDEQDQAAAQDSPSISAMAMLSLRFGELGDVGADARSIGLMMSRVVPVCWM